MKLYQTPDSPNCLRVRAVAAELEIQLSLVNVDTLKGESRTPDFLKLNPNGKVPVLEDGDFVLWESRSINTYLCSLRPQAKLTPIDEKRRAQVEQWMYWQAFHLGPAMQKVIFERVIRKMYNLGSPNEKAIEDGLTATHACFEIFESSLENDAWICGQLSVADFALASTFIYLDRAELDVSKWRKVSSWFEKIQARPSWQWATKSLSK